MKLVFLSLHRKEPTNPPLVLEGGPLSSLAHYVITAFYPNKVDYLGPFASSADLEKALNPSKYPGDSRPTRHSMSIHRARNLDRLYTSELRQFYIAANPEFLPSSKGKEVVTVT